MPIEPQLLKDCMQGDRRAQYQLFRRCFDILMGISLRYQKEDSDAQSLVNMGFLKILQNLDKYQPHVPFEAWIRRIMINTIIDEFRKNRKVQELIEHRDFSAPTASDGVSLNDGDLQLELEQLTALIRKLPAMTQKVFNLYAIDGYNHLEIGEMLGISDGTSKWHLATARKMLQEWIIRERATIGPSRELIP